MLATFPFLASFMMNTVLTMVRHSGRVCLAILKFCTTQCFLKFSSNPSMKFRQFRVPESMFHILKGERDVFLGISTCFWPLLTMQHYCCGQLVLPRYLSKFFFLRLQGQVIHFCNCISIELTVQPKFIGFKQVILVVLLPILVVLSYWSGTSFRYFDFELYR